MERSSSFPVQLMPSGLELSCRADRTLLDAFIQAGIAVAYNCRSGECGECMATLLAGRVHELPGADPAVFSNAHRARGNVLTCMCFPRSPIVLEVAVESAAHAIRPSAFDAVIRRIEPLSPTIVGVTVETSRPIDFRAGQNFEWVLPGIQPNRTYSAANAPGTDFIEFHVRVYPEGKVGALLARAAVGDSFGMIGPYGHFAFSENRWRPCLCIAGGTGLAPILSILEGAFAGGDARPITLLYGARDRSELYRASQLHSWAQRHSSFKFVPVLSHEPVDSAWAGARGLVTDVIRQHLGDVFGLEACVCGPPAMIDVAVSVLEDAGVPSQDIRTDRFVQARPQTSS